MTRSRSASDARSAGEPGGSTDIGAPRWRRGGIPPPPFHIYRNQVPPGTRPGSSGKRRAASATRFAEAARGHPDGVVSTDPGHTRFLKVATAHTYPTTAIPAHQASAAAV